MLICLTFPEMRVVLFLVPNNVYYISLFPIKKGCNSSMSSKNTEKKAILKVLLREELQLRAVTTMVILFCFFLSFFFFKEIGTIKGQGRQ